MNQASRDELNRLLSTAETGDAKAADELVSIVYDELRRLAQKYFRDERPGHTLQPTALVHEAYLRLVDQSRVSYQGRRHFLAAAARTMRRVLVDYARHKGRQRRGGGQRPLAIDTELSPAEVGDHGILEIDDALARLAQLNERQASVVEMRFFGGMSVDEVADQLGVSRRTVEDDWTHAKAWLRLRMSGDLQP
jgi:RNA polymerase sigma factor (TIGR02999 family)